jgi:hypothetical protein
MIASSARITSHTLPTSAGLRSITQPARLLHTPISSRSAHLLRPLTLHVPALFPAYPTLSRSLATSTSPATSTSSSPSSDSSSPSNLGLTQRLKALFRTHGWSALTIYLLLSLLDFSLTFLLIYAVGADKVREAEDWVLDALGWRRKDGEPGKIKKAMNEWKENHPRASKAGAVVKSAPVPALAPASPGEGRPEAQNGYSAIATTAVLAYAIHKTLLLPVRIGVTVSHAGCDGKGVIDEGVAKDSLVQTLITGPPLQVAITPKIVRTLQAWG